MKRKTKPERAKAKPRKAREPKKYVIKDKRTGRILTWMPLQDCGGITGDFITVTKL